MIQEYGNVLEFRHSIFCDISHDKQYYHMQQVVKTFSNMLVREERYNLFKSVASHRLFFLIKPNQHKNLLLN